MLLVIRVIFWPILLVFNSAIFTSKRKHTLLPRKFCTGRNNKKVDSVETGHIVIADLLP